MSIHSQTKTSGYTKYPLSSLLIYNGITILHYLFGGLSNDLEN